MKAVTDDPLIPKIIVVVMDDDIIKLFHDYQEGLSKGMGRVIDNIMIGFDRTIACHKDYLDDKSKKENYPLFLWIQAPRHKSFSNNAERIKFNKCLDRMSSYHANTRSLQLKKIWDAEDSTLFVKESRRFTAKGLDAYWEAVDKTIKYCDTLLMKKMNNKKKNKGSAGIVSVKSDRFHWQKPNLAKNGHTNRPESHKSESDRRKLPSPPMKKQLKF